MRKFFDKYEYAWEYEYPFGEDFLRGIFGDNYKRVYSLSGDGIFNIVTMDNKYYSIDLKKGTSMLANDGKLAFRDETKDKVMFAIKEQLDKNSIHYTYNSGKFICFKYNNFILKI